jgi:hypothetical protein
MNTESVLEFLIAFVVMMIVALQMRIIQITNGPHDMPDEALKS